jgi:hypothetical protein
LLHPITVIEEEVKMVINRPDISEYDPRYSRYMELVPEDSLFVAMKNQTEATISFMLSIPAEKYDFRYAVDKWTVREVFGHLCDIERAFGYRTLCAARGDQVDLKRVDGNLYIQNGEFGRLSTAELAQEFEAARKSNMMLLQHLPESAWDRPALVAGAKITVRALGYLMVGHERHHLRILKDRYLIGEASNDGI